MSGLITIISITEKIKRMGKAFLSFIIISLAFFDSSESFPFLAAVFTLTLNYIFRFAGLFKAEVKTICNQSLSEKNG